MDRYLNVTEARAKLLLLVEKLHPGDKVIVTKRGVPRAVIVHFDRYRLLEDLAWVHQDPTRRGRLEEGWRQFESGDSPRTPKRARPSLAADRALAAARRRK